MISPPYLGCAAAGPPSDFQNDSGSVFCLSVTHGCLREEIDFAIGTNVACVPAAFPCSRPPPHPHPCPHAFPSRWGLPSLPFLVLLPRVHRLLCGRSHSKREPQKPLRPPSS